MYGMVFAYTLVAGCSISQGRAKDGPRRDAGKVVSRFFQ